MQANTLIVYAKTEPEAGAHGITAFIVEKGMNGFRLPTSVLHFCALKVPFSVNLSFWADNGTINHLPALPRSLIS
jgi:hypothetical protein